MERIYFTKNIGICQALGRIQMLDVGGWNIHIISKSKIQNPKDQMNAKTLNQNYEVGHSGI